MPDSIQGAGNRDTKSCSNGVGEADNKHVDIMSGVDGCYEKK